MCNKIMHWWGSKIGRLKSFRMTNAIPGLCALNWKNSPGNQTTRNDSHRMDLHELYKLRHNLERTWITNSLTEAVVTQYHKKLIAEIDTRNTRPQLTYISYLPGWTWTSNARTVANGQLHREISNQRKRLQNRKTKPVPTDKWMQIMLYSHFANLWRRLRSRLLLLELNQKIPDGSW